MALKRLLLSMATIGLGIGLMASAALAENLRVLAWDGYADRLDGGTGTDRAWKDKLDRVMRVERFG